MTDAEPCGKIIHVAEVSHSPNRLEPRNAGIAQLVEQLICNQQVGGSSPSTSSISSFSVKVNMGGFPSGQREQTVNLSSMTSVVRIHHLPPKQKRHPSGCLFCFGQVIPVDSKGGSYKRAGGTFEPPALIENRAQHGNKDSDLRAGPAAAGRIHHLPYPSGCLFVLVR